MHNPRSVRENKQTRATRDNSYRLAPYSRTRTRNCCPSQTHSMQCRSFLKDNAMMPVSSHKLWRIMYIAPSYTKYLRWSRCPSTSDCLPSGGVGLWRRLVQLGHCQTCPRTGCPAAAGRPMPWRSYWAWRVSRAGVRRTGRRWALHWRWVARPGTGWSTG